MAEKVTIGNCELWHGDCREVLPLLGVCDATITDPPYGVNLGATKGEGGAHGLALEAYESYEDSYENYVAEVVPALLQSIQLTGRAAVFIGPHIHELPKFDALGGVYCSAATGRHQWGFKNFLPVLLYGTYPDLQKGAKQPTVIASNETAEKNGHPVPKPVGWMRWLVALTTRPGETILDPFMGSGTTGVAAVEQGRSFVGIERERKYFDIACRRIEQAYAQPRLFEDAKVGAGDTAVQGDMLLPANAGIHRAAEGRPVE